MKKKLTAGLLREISKGYDIPELKTFLHGRNDDEILDLLNRNDYIETVLWSSNDIADKLTEKGIEPTDNNIKKVIYSGYLKHLGECTEEDWMTIEFAIDNVFK